MIRLGPALVARGKPYPVLLLNSHPCDIVPLAPGFRTQITPLLYFAQECLTAISGDMTLAHDDGLARIWPQRLEAFHPDATIPYLQIPKPDISVGTYCQQSWLVRLCLSSFVAVANMLSTSTVIVMARMVEVLKMNTCRSGASEPRVQRVVDGESMSISLLLPFSQLWYTGSAASWFQFFILVLSLVKLESTFSSPHFSFQSCL